MVMSSDDDVVASSGDETCAVGKMATRAFHFTPQSPSEASTRDLLKFDIFWAYLLNVIDPSGSRNV